MTDLLCDEVSASWGFWDEWANGDWEPSTRRVIFERLAGGGTFVDFGAWVGPTVLWAAQAGADRIVAFEPDAVAFGMLETNVGHTGAELHSEAVWSHDGLVRMAQSGNSMSRVGDPNDPAVNCLTIESAFRRYKIGRPALIKMDVEGAEVPVLRQAEPFLRALGVPLLLSAHSWVPFDAAELLPGWTVELPDPTNDLEMLAIPPKLPPIPGQELTVNWAGQA